jgi:hypothetical protein
VCVPDLRMMHEMLMIRCYLVWDGVYMACFPLLAEVSCINQSNGSETVHPYLSLSDGK